MHIDKVNQPKRKKIIIEQASSIMDLAGSLKDKAMKGKSIDEIVKLEEKAKVLSFDKDFKKISRSD